MRTSCFILLASCAVAGIGHAAPPAPLPDTMPALQAAPELRLKDAAGQSGRLADYRGRWVLVHFWASWCTACLQELPALERLRRDLPELAVLAVNLGDRPAQLRDLQRRLGMPLLRETGGRAMQAWQVEGLPLSCLIDPGGRLVSRIAGSRDWDTAALREWLRQWLESTGPQRSPGTPAS